MPPPSSWGNHRAHVAQVESTHLIVTTPEKWDVVTRKGSDGLVQRVGLLIIDEVSALLS